MLMLAPAVSAYVGIDVAKSHLDIHVLPHNDQQRIPNQAEAIAALVRQLATQAPPDQITVVLEASGGYERAVHRQLTEAGFKAAIVNAKRVRDFARAKGRLAKTDRLDARTLADFGQQFRPAATPVKDPERIALAEVLTYRDHLNADITVCRQQLAALQSPWVRQRANDRLVALIAERDAATQELGRIIADNEALRSLADLIRTFIGAGLILAAVLLAHLPELGRLSDKQIASLVGLAPFNRDSGTLRGKRMIQGGRAAVRKVLYVCALTAIRRNPSIAPFYQRLVGKGKPGKVAVVAAMRKMIVILNAMARDQQPWTAPTATGS